MNLPKPKRAILISELGLKQETLDFIADAVLPSRGAAFEQAMLNKTNVLSWLETYKEDPELKNENPIAHREFKKLATLFKVVDFMIYDLP